MKYRIVIFLGLALLFFAFFLTACQRKNNVCPDIEKISQPKLELADLIASPPPDHHPDPVTVEIGRELQTVDILVDYPLCNDKWSGTVYVSCDVLVAQTELDNQDNPLFFKGCNLEIEPGTIVYVAAHNDAAYYKGCSCHTGEDPIP